MAPYFPPPSRETLLLPLLACLPIAFVSTRPPPALLPLLSPVLRQRVKILYDSLPSDSTWLSLLCWESAEASELSAIVETVSFEPHPVSGEVELGEIEQIQYRKLDEETLQSILRLPEANLEVVCLWCENDHEGGEDGWRVGELKPLRDASKDTSRPWYNTVSEADEKFREDATHEPSRTSITTGFETGMTGATEVEDNDEAYWAQYDQTQSQTPGPSLTQNLPTPYSRTANTQAEDDYYSRYENVQPEIDSDDPSANREAIGYSSLSGDSLSRPAPSATEQLPQRTLVDVQPQDAPVVADESIVHTRPSSSSSSSAIAQLELSAHSQSQAEIAIQYHVSTTMKSLYRLTRGAGIELSEFRRIVQNELDTVSMMDEE